MAAESAREHDSTPELPPLAPPATGRRSGWLLALVLGLLGVVLVLGGWLVWNSPHLAAQRAYKQGLAAQLQGRFEEAQACYRRALQLDSDFGLAAFSLGTTYLRFGDPSLLQSIETLSERAVQGDTQALDEADRWFRETIRIADRLPPDTRLMDQNIRDPLKLRAFARACLAVTAIIRASAAIQAEQFEDGMAWLEVVSREAQAAIADDPGNAIAAEALRNLPPIRPGGQF
jgi:tetratricopeptide (TPR) repeat protein